VRANNSTPKKTAFYTVLCLPGLLWLNNESNYGTQCCTSMGPTLIMVWLPWLLIQTFQNPKTFQTQAFQIRDSKQYNIHSLLLQTRCKQNQLTNSVAQEPEGSSLHSQQPATGLCPEPVECNPHPPKPISLRSILIPSFHLRLGLPSGLFPSGFSTKTIYTFLSFAMRATTPAHLFRLDLT
jgi:hypothetical protein